MCLIILVIIVMILVEIEGPLAKIFVLDLRGFVSFWLR